MIVVVTSAMNDCQYCVVAHGAILRIRARNPLIADQIAINYLKADLSERQVIMLKLALKITSSSGEVTDADLDEARTARLTEFIDLVNQRHDPRLTGFHDLHRWSVQTRCVMWFTARK